MTIKKRRLFRLIGLLVVLLAIGTSKSVMASVAEKGTTVGVEFEATVDSSGNPKPKPKPKPPVIDGGGQQIDSKLLPKTGEVITSLIVMLIGISIAVFVLGMMILKKTYQEHDKLSWEY